jgi:hypothetical protein
LRFSKLLAGLDDLETNHGIGLALPLLFGVGILAGTILSSFAISIFIGGVSVHSCRITCLEMLSGSVPAFRGTVGAAVCGTGGAAGACGRSGATSIVPQLDIDSNCLVGGVISFTSSSSSSAGINSGKSKFTTLSMRQDTTGLRGTTSFP